MVTRQSQADDSAARDGKALEMRVKGRSFVAIANKLGFDGINQANQAFNRALRLRSPEERDRFRRQELIRLDGMVERVKSSLTMEPAEVATRLNSVERLRSRLLAE
jgi:hypothetical protein